jgi:hypothetical protein
MDFSYHVLFLEGKTISNSVFFLVTSTCLILSNTVSVHTQFNCSIDVIGDDLSLEINLKEFCATWLIAFFNLAFIGPLGKHSKFPLA